MSIPVGAVPCARPMSKRATASRGSPKRAKRVLWRSRKGRPYEEKWYLRCLHTAYTAGVYHTLIGYRIAKQYITRSDEEEMSLKKASTSSMLFLVGAGGFGPPKSVTTDLQSAPFGRSGTLPGAGERSRTINLLITNQLLCH